MKVFTQANQGTRLGIFHNLDTSEDVKYIQIHFLSWRLNIVW